ncbi:ROK family transcriptional regulator [Streptomyces avicenniae]|uniref:ROK family transcriptional regulator n=1 Tax=Streptomyces avicenniae TaxID=500153 RepID=UPI000699C001|nr:ROK family transcriptional regulator [Streptomyces avicenniae]
MRRTGPVSAGPAAGTAAVLHLLRDGRPRTRAELATEAGLARSTVAERVDVLLESGLVGRTDNGRSTGGRPPSMFVFNPTARAVLAVDVGARHVRTAVTDLLGAVLAEDYRALEVTEGPRTVLQHVCEQGAALLARAGRTPSDLLGTGIGLPGPVAHATGRPTNPPIMPGWDGFDVPGFVRQRLDTAVLVDNDVNIMALGEHRTHWADRADMIFVKVATGIGSGLIAGGELHRGSQGVAGDMGHVRLQSGIGAVCRCGSTGCLEAVAGGAAIAARLTAAGIPADTSTDVAALARAGSMPAVALVRQAGRAIGEVLATAVSFFNPSVIVIGGGLSQAGAHLIAGVREVVYQRSLPLASQELRIVHSHAGDRAAVLGAAFMVIEQALDPTHLPALLGP